VQDRLRSEKHYSNLKLDHDERKEKAFNQTLKDNEEISGKLNSFTEKLFAHHTRAQSAKSERV
jgi:hypothetical protein